MIATTMSRGHTNYKAFSPKPEIKTRDLCHGLVRLAEFSFGLPKLFRIEKRQDMIEGQWRHRFAMLGDILFA